MPIVVWLWAWVGLAGAADDAVALCYPSGLRVYVMPRQGPPIVGLGMVVRGGSSAEDKGEEGVAHLLEHLWFRSIRDDGRSVNETLEQWGAEANAYTTHDETIFLTVSHERMLSQLLSLGAQQVLDPLGDLSEDVVARERDVVRSELRERHDGGAPLVSAVMGSLVADHDPYGRSVGGSDETVSALTLNTAAAYAGRIYKPENVSLVIAGDVELDSIRKELRTSFPRAMMADPRLPRDVGARTCDDRRMPAPELAAVRVDTDASEVVSQVDEPTAMALWPAGAGFDDAERARVAAVLMDIEIAQRTKAHAPCPALPQPRLPALTRRFPLTGVRDPERQMAAALKAVDRLFRDAADQYSSRGPMLRQITGLVEGFRQRAREGDAERLDVSPSGFLGTVAIEFHWYNKPTPPSAVEAHQVGEFGRSLRSPRLLIVRPPETALTGATIHGGRGRTEPASDAEHVPLTLDALRALVVPPPLDELEVATLPSGRVVWVVPMRGGARSHLSLVHLADEGWGQGSVRLAAATALPDPEDRLPDARWGELWRRGAELSWTNSAEAWGLDARAPRLGDAIRALRAATPDPVRLAGRRVVRRRFAERSEWRTEFLHEPDMVAERIRWAALSDGMVHPMLDDEGFEALRGVRRGSARAFAKRALAPERASLLAVVNESAESALQPLVSMLERRKESPPVRVPRIEPKAAQPRAITVVADSVTTQAAVALACHIDDADPVASLLIRSMLEKRLNDELRNDLGATYGVRAAQYREAHGLTLEIHTRVAPGRSGEAVRGLLAGVQAMADGDVSVRELDDLKRTAAMRTVTQWQTADDVMGLLRRALVSGVDPREYDLADGLWSVTPADLARAVAPCRDFESLTVAGDLERIEASLKASGLSFRTVQGPPDSAGAAP